MSKCILILFIYKHNFKNDVHAPFKFVTFYVIIFFLINFLSLAVLLCQLYNSTAIVAILIKLLYCYISIFASTTISMSLDVIHMLWTQEKFPFETNLYKNRTWPYNSQKSIMCTGIRWIWQMCS